VREAIAAICRALGFEIVPAGAGAPGGRQRDRFIGNGKIASRWNTADGGALTVQPV
jgi:hypothetical protein